MVGAFLAHPAVQGGLAPFIVGVVVADLAFRPTRSAGAVLGALFGLGSLWAFWTVLGVAKPLTLKLERWKCGALRASRLPGLCRRVVRLFDRHVVPRFEAYVRETSARLGHLQDLLGGAEPAWEAEPARDSSPRVFWLRGRLVLPAKLL